MAYLNNSAITVDAILTKKGRELLAKGEEFKITQFALADDEIDYTLWNANHPSGSNYYGEAIENLPILEAVPDETQVMRFKLVTLPKDTARMPRVQIPDSSITLTAYGESAIISPNTFPATMNKTLGYTCILHDSDAAQLKTIKPLSNDRFKPTIPNSLSAEEARHSVTAIGFEFEIVAKKQPLSDKSTFVTIIGNETGGVDTVNLTVTKQTRE